MPRMLRWEPSAEFRLLDSSIPKLKVIYSCIYSKPSNICHDWEDNKHKQKLYVVFIKIVQEVNWKDPEQHQQIEKVMLMKH